MWGIVEMMVIVVFDRRLRTVVVMVCHDLSVQKPSLVSRHIRQRGSRRWSYDRRMRRANLADHDCALDYQNRL